MIAPSVAGSRIIRTCWRGLSLNLDEQIGKLPILRNSERKQLAAWNDTGRDYDLDYCLHDLFEAQVRRTPDFVAAIFQGMSSLTEI